MERNDLHAEAMFDSPLAELRAPVAAPDALAEGPVRFLLVSGLQLLTAPGGWSARTGCPSTAGAVGSSVSPDAIPPGSEMVRSVKSALARGWTHEQVYRWWQEQVGVAGTMIN